MGSSRGKVRPHWWPREDWEYWKLLKALDALYSSKNVSPGLSWKIPQSLVWLPKELRDLGSHHIGELMDTLIIEVCANFDVIHPRVPSHPSSGQRISWDDWRREMELKTH